MANDETLAAEPSPPSVTGTDLIPASETLPAVAIKREQSRERSFRYRRRQRAGRIVVPVEIDPALAEDILIGLDLLAIERADDFEALCAAFQAFVHATLIDAASRVTE